MFVQRCPQLGGDPVEIAAIRAGKTSTYFPNSIFKAAG
jgi:hypothetical protein